jgi:hypothetical protein
VLGAHSSCGLFVRLAELQALKEQVEGQDSARNAVQLEMPSEADLVKVLIAGQSAEVVELADTPS